MNKSIMALFMAPLLLVAKPTGEVKHEHPFGQPACDKDEFGVIVMVYASDVNPLTQRDVLLLCGKGPDLGHATFRIQAYKPANPDPTPTPEDQWRGNDGQAKDKSQEF